jgi:hypothetical protein
MEKRMGKDDKGESAGEVREFFDATMKAFNQYLVGKWKPEIGEVGPSDFPFLTHPRRKREVVATQDDRKTTFSASFVKECLDASKDGENELLNYLYDKYGTA